MLLDDIAAQLEADVVATGTTTFVIFLGQMPDGQDEAIGIYEAPGDQPESDGAPGAPEYDFPDFQVRVRGKAMEYDIARNKMQGVFDSLHDATISGYVFVFATSSPFLLRYDEQERPIIALNFKAMRARS